MARRNFTDRAVQKSGTTSPLKKIRVNNQEKDMVMRLRTFCLIKHIKKAIDTQKIRIGDKNWNKVTR